MFFTILYMTLAVELFLNALIAVVLSKIQSPFFNCQKPQDELPIADLCSIISSLSLSCTYCSDTANSFRSLALNIHITGDRWNTLPFRVCLVIFYYH